MSPEGIGRRPDVVKRIADRAGLPTMLVTGIYREPFVPAWVREASIAEVADFLRGELTAGVTDTGVPAGLIKLSQNATGMTLTERRILEASSIVTRETNAAIASHITAGPTALSVMDALERFGCPLDRYRFIWVHAQVTAVAAGAVLEDGRPGADHGMAYVMSALERGAYVSLDAIGNRNASPGIAGTDANIAWIRRLVDAGHEDRIIIGSDTGWYDPGFPPGYEVEQVHGRWTMVGAQAQDYRFIPAEFVPAMEAAGLSSDLVRKLMHENPWSAFSRSSPRAG
jgi:phosphotriesterase-related protein